MRFPLMGKVAGVGAVVAGLMVALGMVGSIVGERQMRQNEAQANVADSLAAQQRWVGPMLQRRCEERWTSVVGEGKEAKTIAESRTFLLATTPKALDIDASATPEPRYRGLFKVNGYALKARVSAQWQNLAALRPHAEHTASRLVCDAPEMLVGVGDARGLRQVALRVQGQPVDVLPGTPRKNVAQGFHARLAEALVEGDTPVKVEIVVDLVGTEALAIAPVGDTTHVQITSAWPHPSFQGRFLPNERTVGPQGFKANWELSALATSAPRDLLADAPQVESFGVAFIDPVNPYVLSDRATKYGLLFVLLTFVGVGLLEVMQRLRVHPIQYLLVGCALALFFLLLVSLTEHLAFGWAYLAAASGCTLLLAFYGSSVLGGVRRGAAFGAAIAALYGALYVLLQQEQAALVLGSLLLFAVLAAVMVATRRLDWYALLAELRQPRRGHTAASFESQEPLS
jgi:inner membrane protein